jgi:hypothetical protein
MAMDSQIFDIGFLDSYFQEIRGLMEEEKKTLKRRNYLDLLLYS